jgi:O-antigen/teichoic acid export membrane protein
VATAAILSSTLLAFVIVYVLSAIVYLLVSRKITLGWCQFETNDEQLSVEMKYRIKKHVNIVMINTLLLFLITKESELLFLKYYAEGEDLGLFKVAHRLGFAIALLLPGIFEGIMLPLMSGSIAKSKDVAAVRFNESIKYVMILAIPAAFFCAIFSKDIIFILYGDEYSRAVIPFMILVSTCCICSIASVPTSYLLSVDKQSLILKVMLVGTVLKLSLDYYLVSRYGLLGASFAFSISFLFMFVANLVIAMKHVGVNFPWLQMLKLLLASLVSVGLIFLIPDLGQPPLVGLAVSGIVFSGIYFSMTLLLRCWRKQEVSFVREKLATSNLSVLKPLDALLEWAAR